MAPSPTRVEPVTICIQTDVSDLASLRTTIQGTVDGVGGRPSGHATRACQSAIRAGRSVVVSSADPSSAQRLAEEIGGRAVASNRQATDGVDLTVLAVPAAAVPGVVTELGDAAKDSVPCGDRCAVGWPGARARAS